MKIAIERQDPDLFYEKGGREKLEHQNFEPILAIKLRAILGKVGR